MRRMTRWILVLVVLLTSAGGVAMGAPAAQGEPAGEEIVVADDFDNPATSLFQPEEVGLARMTHESGRLRVEGRDFPPASYLSLDLPVTAQDGTITADAGLLDGNVNAYVAVGCRGSLNTTDAGYTFIVSPVDRYVGLYRREQGVNIFMSGVFLEPGTGITPDGAGIDRISLRCHGTTMTGVVNGVDVINVTDDQYLEGYFYLETGMFADAGGSPMAEFDNLSVSVPAIEQHRQAFSMTVTSAALDQLAEDARVQPPLSGPVSGAINLTGIAGSYQTSDEIAEFDDLYATVRFQSGADATTHPWDGLLVFRNNAPGMGYLVLVSSAGFWEVMHLDGTYLAKGTIPNLDRAAGSSITLEVAAIGSDGYLRISGSAAAQFDLSAGPPAGGLLVGSGMLPGNNRAGEAISYDQLEVWSLAGTGT